jgi:hypothetical protein
MAHREAIAYRETRLRRGARPRRVIIAHREARPHRATRPCRHGYRALTLILAVNGRLSGSRRH